MKAARPTTASPRRATTLLAALALVVVAALPYLQTLHFEIALDDPVLLTDVGRTASDGGATALFTSDFRLGPDCRLGYYRPVTTWSLWRQIEPAWRSGGADALPAAAHALHAVNLLLHVVCTLLVWRIVRRFGAPAWSAWLAAALFAVIPSHVEPVAYIAARTDSLAAMFTLASVLCWLELARAARGVRTVLLIAGPLLALAGALAKEQALMLPLVLAAWSWLLPELRARWVWLVPWVLAAGVAVMLRVVVAHVPFGPTHAVEHTGSLAWFVRLGLPALLLYFRLWFWPWPLNGYYMRNHLGLGWPEVLAMGAMIGCVLLARRGGRNRQVAAALVFTLVFLAPVLHIAPLQGAVAAERFFYLPSVGLALLTALALWTLEGARRSRALSRAGMGVVIAGCAVLSTIGARRWADDKTVFTCMVASSPLAPHAHQGLADNLAKEGKYAESARECREAIRLNPNYVDSYEQLGIVSAQLGDTKTARQSFERALHLDPERASTHGDLGVLEMNEGRIDEALPHFRRAAELDPREPRVHYQLGLALGMSGDAPGVAGEIAILNELDAKTAARLLHDLAAMDSSHAP